MNAAKPPGASPPPPIRIPTGTRTRKGKVYQTEIVIFDACLAALLVKAMENKDGLAQALGGGIVARAWRVKHVTVVVQREDGALVPDRPGASR